VKVLAKLKNEILDLLAFLTLGYRGPLGRWAANRVINHWFRLPEDNL